MASKQSYRKQYCHCISRKCGEVVYIDETGKLQRGNKIFQHLCRTHELEDERFRLATSTEPPEPAPIIGSNSAVGPMDALIQRLRLSTFGNNRQTATVVPDQIPPSSIPGNAHHDSPPSNPGHPQQSSSLVPPPLDDSSSSPSRNELVDPNDINTPIYDTSTFPISYKLSSLVLN